MAKLLQKKIIAFKLMRFELNVFSLFKSFDDSLTRVLILFFFFFEFSMKNTLQLIFSTAVHAQMR